MKQQSNFSDEMINAYVDGELSTEDELSLIEAMQTDTDLAHRVNELKRVKLLVTKTYRVSKSKNETSANKARLSMVASVLLLVGVISGWLSHDVLLNESDSKITLTEKKKDTWNIVLHVNTNDKYIQKTILDETESLLESFKESDQKVKVEIVAYGKGVFLFDSEKSKFKKRLSLLKGNFSNLSYAVCGRTVKRLEKIENRKIRLISNMTVARSGIYQIIKRQKQGWNYIRI